MKLITVGDIHGRQYWKEIDPAKYDKIIFVGDYVDQFPPMSDVEIESNLLEIIELKKNNPDKVILLLGNHDIQYLFWNEGYGCSGYRPTMANNLHAIFKHHKDLFQIAYQIENYIWTHAGISNGWYDYNKKEIIDIQERFDCKNLADTFNHMLWLNENRLLHQIGRKRGGMYLNGGITWADRDETKNDYLVGYNQIVGHTPIQTITKFGDDTSSIRYIDVLNEAYFADEDRKSAIAKWGKDFDKEYNYIAPPLTKFYEFENEHWV